MVLALKKGLLQSMHVLANIIEKGEFKLIGLGVARVIVTIALYQTK